MKAKLPLLEAHLNRMFRRERSSAGSGIGGYIRRDGQFLPIVKVGKLWTFEGYRNSHLRDLVDQLRRDGHDFVNKPTGDLLK